MIMSHNFRFRLLGGVALVMAGVAPSHVSACENDLAQLRASLAGMPAPIVAEQNVQIDAAQDLLDTGDLEGCREVVADARAQLSQQQGALQTPHLIVPIDEEAREKIKVAVQEELGAGQPLSGLSRADLIREMDVVTRDGTHVGQIVDVAINFDDSRVAYALLAIGGGFFSFEDEKLYPIPLDAFRTARDPDLIYREEVERQARLSGQQPIADKVADEKSAAGSNSGSDQSEQKSSNQQKDESVGEGDVAEPVVEKYQRSVLVLDVDPDILERAPSFEEGVLLDQVDAEWHELIVTFYQTMLSDQGQ